MKRRNSKAEAVSKSNVHKILVVEDDRSHRVLMDKILQRAGFTTELAKDGLVALEYLQRGQEYDLIIMDWDMPELDGLDTTRAIRAREQVEGGERTPILAFTASRSAGDREQCLAAGMDAYLPKDIWMPKWHLTLTDTLKKLIDGRAGVENLYQLSGTARQRAAPDGELEYVLDVFDEETYRQAANLFKDEIAIAVQEFIEDAENYIQRIRLGLQNRDLKMMAKATHPLKSNSKSFGLLSVAQLAEAINAICEQTSSKEIALKTSGMLLPKLEEAFSYGAQALKDRAYRERQKMRGTL